MSTPVDIFDFLIAPLREADAKDGQDFLYRFLRGCQYVWERTDENLRSIPKLWSVDDCPDEFLWYLKNIVGWTKQFDSLLRSLSFDELRRLISISGMLWKERGSDDALLDVLYFSTGARCRYWNWFDFRWILDETALGEEHEGRDPWIIDLPDPDVSGSEYESNLRIVDDGSLNRTLVARLVELCRGSGERWETTFLGFLDQFKIDGDDSQWKKELGTTMEVAEGRLVLEDLTYAVFASCNVETAIWPEAMISARLKCVGAVMGAEILFNFIDLDNGYALIIIPEDSAFATPSQLMLVKMELGSQVGIAGALLPDEPIRPDVYYTYRIVITNEGGVGKRIKVYIDGNEKIDALDDPSLLPEGTIGLVAVFGGIEVDEVEAVLIPQDQPPVRAVPEPLVMEWTVAGDTAARTVTLPLVQNRTEGALNYDFIVDWGDGTTPDHVAAWDDSNRIHTYSGDGTYQMSIRGVMEGWSFNGNSDAPKLTKIVSWGKQPWFQGFAYLKNGFKGCTNLESIQGDPIPAAPAYIPGVRSDGFEGLFYGCSSLVEIFSDLFDDHPRAETFRDAFRDCTSLSSLVDNLFYHNFEYLQHYCFSGTFRGCTGLYTLPVNLFAYETPRTFDSLDYTFESCFRDCTGLTVLPVGFKFKGIENNPQHAFDSCFRGCTSLTNIAGGGAIFSGCGDVLHYGWQDCFRDCTALVSVVGALFDGPECYGGVYAFAGCFRDCTALQTVGWGLFKDAVATANHGFDECFRGCSALESVPGSLFRWNLLCGGFVRTFYECVKLELNEWIFYDNPTKFTRFAGVGYQFCDFTECFYRSSFSGVAGKAPELWKGTFGERIEISPTPATPWVTNDDIVGFTSGDSCRIDAPTANPAYYDVKMRQGYFQLDEVIGVVGNPFKQADQNATHPSWYRKIVSETCFDGAGNDASSITNYTSIPSNWL